MLPWIMPVRDPNAPLPERPALARDRVRHVGEEVVVIIAETVHQAMDAAESRDPYSRRQRRR